jgi:hypothetical protein
MEIRLMSFTVPMPIERSARKKPPEAANNNGASEPFPGDILIENQYGQRQQQANSAEQCDCE